MLAFVLTAAAQVASYVPSGQWARSTKELAAEMLAAEQARDVLSHHIDSPLFPGGEPFSVRFTGRPRLGADGFCVRQTYYVSIASRSEGSARRPAVVRPQLRQGSCQGIFAHVNPNLSLEEAKAALRWLREMRESARSSGELQIELRCTSDVQTDRCAAGAREALAGLPIEKTYIVEQPSQQASGEWRFAITETQPGDLLWEVRVSAAEDGRKRLELRWTSPAPF